MKFKSKLFLSMITPLIFLSALYFYSFFKDELPPQELVKEQLAVSPLSPQSVWSQGYLNKNSVVKDKMIQLEKGTLCQSLKGLDTKNLTHKQISNQLKDFGYICVVRPLAVNPKARTLSYLKIDNTTTINPQERGVAHQEICQDQLQPECVIRLKRDGFPLNRRSNPHSTKAVLIDAGGDPARYDNEAFKIGVAGQAIPKGPSVKFGLKKCPYKKNKDLCDQWIDAIMEQAHPMLKEPVGTGVHND